MKRLFRKAAWALLVTLSLAGTTQAGSFGLFYWGRWDCTSCFCERPLNAFTPTCYPYGGTNHCCGKKCCHDDRKHGCKDGHYGHGSKLHALQFSHLHNVLSHFGLHRLHYLRSAGGCESGSCATPSTAPASDAKTMPTTAPAGKSAVAPATPAPAPAPLPVPVGVNDKAPTTLGGSSQPLLLMPISYPDYPGYGYSGYPVGQPAGK
jgi:hypothetical protein